MLWPAKLLFYITLIVLLASCSKPPAYRISTQFNAQEAGALAQAPYLLPKCFNTTPPQDLKILVSAVGIDGVKNGACNVKRGGKNPDFELRWSKAKMASIVTQVAEISVRAENIFSDSNENRTQLKSSFIAFQKSLATLEEDENKACLNKGDAQIISQRTANALPLRLDEILAFNYGFDSSNRVIDLHAGMRLRIEHGAYQFIDPQDDSSAAYVGRGSSYLHIIQRTNHTLAFEPYLGSLKAIEVQGNADERGRTRMISGAMGLVAVGVSRRYARLVYPTQYPTTKNTTAVASGGELLMRVGLLLADSAADLASATQRYIDDSGCAADQSNSVMCFYFSGRSFVIPEVLVKIQATEKYVPVGTTLRDAFNRYTVTPFKHIGNMSTVSFSPKLIRWVQPAH